MVADSTRNVGFVCSARFKEQTADSVHSHLFNVYFIKSALKMWVHGKLLYQQFNLKIIGKPRPRPVI